MAEEKTEAAEAPKKSKKLLLIIIIAVVVLGGGGAGAFFMLKSDKAEAKPAPVKGAVVSMDNAITINLADAHYLKLGFTLQLTEAAGETAPDIAEAIDLAIDEYTGLKIGELETEKGREAKKADLLAKIEKAYTVEGATESPVMDIYFTQFVTQ
ncbi:flagellar basal body-associated protein FliL [Actinoplanes sp. NPDC049265]|uniref:flagellar basal body-associated FliL family protein n=1 Tax=Actinoplanes sp. NPDC049265 TaxID=3363902 RepID=UPI0037111EC5